MPTVKTCLLAAVVVLWTALPAVAKEPRDSRQRLIEPQPGSRKESERDAAIRRAREEISRNPKQKKFILFRYGLSEQDLR